MSTITTITTMITTCHTSGPSMRTAPPCSRLGALVSLALLAACGSGEKAAAPASAAVAAAAVRDTAALDSAAVAMGGFTLDTARSMPWRESWQLPARLVLDPTSTQTLGSIVEGRVTQVLVQPGDRVRRGQILVTIHSHELTDAFNALAQARAGKVEAAAEAQVSAAHAARSERLYAARAGSLAELERARAANTAAQAGERRAAAEFLRASEMVDHLHAPGPDRRGVDAEDVLVRAPFDGVVVDRVALPGGVVLPGASLLTVSRAANVLLELRVPEAALGAAQVGGEVRFSVPAYPGRAFRGRIMRVAPALDSLSRTAEVFASVENRDGALRGQMTASAELFGAATDDVIAVPASAVQDFEGDTVVVTGVMRGTGMMLEAVRVRVGRRAAGMAEITRGLTTGTVVIGTGAAIARAEVLRQRDARADTSAPE